MQESKGEILVVWDYSRADLLLPFNKLSNKFSFKFLFFSSSDEDSVKDFTYQKIYWNNYKNIRALIEDNNPSLILFQDLSDIRYIILNVIARKKGINTLQLEHGLKLDFHYYLEYYRRKTEKKAVSPTLDYVSNLCNKIKTLVYILRSYYPTNITTTLGIIKMIWALAKNASEKTFSLHRFDLRKPTKFVTFSRQHFNYYKERDGAIQEEMVYTGSYFLDDIIKIHKEINENNHYYILIDSADLNLAGVGKADKMQFIGKLNEYCLTQNKKLFVKLHPSEYNQKPLLRHENIFYHRNTNLNHLIKNSAGVFAFTSSIVLPFIVLGGIILFKINSKISYILQKEGVTMLPFNNFKIDEINFKRKILPKENKAKFVEKFLHQIDGMSLKRLEGVLHQYKN